MQLAHGRGHRRGEHHVHVQLVHVQRRCGDQLGPQHPVTVAVFTVEHGDRGRGGRPEQQDVRGLERDAEPA